MKKLKVLYIEDMEKCFDNTQRALGNEYEIDWKKNVLDAIEAIKGDISQYDAAIFDVNLLYDSSKPDSEQTKEGLNLIKILREKVINLPIFCVSSQNNKKSALEQGVDEFMWKKEFWDGKGKQKLDEYLKKSKNLNLAL